MDPQACYRRWAEAKAAGDEAEAAEAHRDLLMWIDRGGFEPSWSSSERARFLEWSASLKGGIS